MDTTSISTVAAVPATQVCEALATAPADGGAMVSSLPAGWVWAVALVAIVALVVAGWLTEKRMANQLAAGVIDAYGTACLPDLTKHHQASSMTALAKLLTAAADLVRAVADLVKSLFGGGGSSPPAAQ